MELLSRVNQPCRQPPTDRETDRLEGAVLVPYSTHARQQCSDTVAKRAKTEVVLSFSIGETISGFWHWKQPATGGDTVEEGAPAGSGEEREPKGGKRRQSVESWFQTEESLAERGGGMSE